MGFERKFVFVVGQLQRILDVYWIYGLVGGCHGWTHTRARTHAHTHARTRMHARMHSHLDKYRFYLYKISKKNWDGLWIIKAIKKSV